MTVAKFLIYLVANIIWRRIGGKDSAPPIRIPRSKGPIDIPVVAPWQMVVTAWVARKVWAAVGGQVKDSLASSPNMAARQVGSWLPDPPASKDAQTAPAKSGHKASKSAAPARAPQTWTSTAQPAASTPTPKSKPAPPTRDYGTRHLDDADAAGAANQSDTSSVGDDLSPSAYWAADSDSASSSNSARLPSPFQKARRAFWNGPSK